MFFPESIRSSFAQPTARPRRAHQAPCRHPDDIKSSRCALIMVPAATVCAAFGNTSSPFIGGSVPSLGDPFGTSALPPRSVRRHAATDRIDFRKPDGPRRQESAGSLIFEPPPRRHREAYYTRQGTLSLFFRDPPGG